MAYINIIELNIWSVYLKKKIFFFLKNIKHKWIDSF